MKTDFNFQPEILEDELVKLVPLTGNDFSRLFAVAADPAIWEQHPAKDRYKKEVFQLFFDGAVASNSAFLVVDKKGNEVIGSTRFYAFEPEQSSIAIGFTFLAKNFWGGQYNKAMKKLLLHYVFQFVNRVVFHIGPTNIRSQNAVCKIGATKINEVYLDNNGSQVLHYEYAIKKQDWKG